MKVWPLVLVALAACEAPPGGPTPFAVNATLIDAPPEGRIPAGLQPDGTAILPGGRRISPAGRQVELGGFLLGVRLLPGGAHALTTDGGYYDEFLSLVDLASGAVVQQIPFRKDAGEALFLGLAVRADGRVFASGGGSDRIHAYDYDPARAEPLQPAASVALPARSYVAGIAFADDTHLVAALQRAGALALIDTASGEEIGRVDLGASSAPYDVAAAPARREAYVSLWAQRAVAVIDLAGASPALVARVEVGKNPEALLLDPPDAPTRLLVASSDSDLISVIDLATRRVTREVSVAPGEPTRLGSVPNHLALGRDGTRLYVANAGENCIDVLSTDTFDRIGRIPTAWYPTAVAVLPSGGLVVTNAKGMGGGPSSGTSFDYGIMKGTLSIIDPAPGDAQLAADTQVVDDNNQRPRQVGPRVQCPADVPCRWPLPPESGLASPIEHVVLIVRENKTYDATLGDLERGDGDPDLVLFGERYTPNLHALARTFALGDNFYSNAEASIQGHQWSAGGTTTDFTEKAWLTTWGRETRDVIEFGKPIAAPEQGYYFQHLEAAGVDYIDYGEIVGFGAGEVAIDVLWPGGLAFNLETRDRSKADYFRTQVEAGILRRFTYMLLPNNHTVGLQPDAWTPEFMVADNDEATGIVVDALSHSPYWGSTAIFIIEDDPQDGADHVEAHRSTLVVVSPWVRHGAVVSSHYDMASLWRTIELLLGLPPQSQSTAGAAPMLDLWASEPDLTPYEYIPSNLPEEFNPAATTRLAELSARLDFTTIDNAPGLGRILWEHMKGEPAPWASMPLPVDLDDVLEGEADGDDDDHADDDD
jgi:YVTN family beta-propeller protein